MYFWKYVIEKRSDDDTFVMKHNPEKVKYYIIYFYTKNVVQMEDQASRCQITLIFYNYHPQNLRG